MLDILDRDGAWCGMQINVSKTKILTVEEQGKGPDIHHMGPSTGGSGVISYLGSEVGQSAKVEKEVAVRLEKGGKVYQMWRRKILNP